MWIDLQGGKEGYYVERVVASGNSPDSVMWEFGWHRSQVLLPR